MQAIKGHGQKLYAQKLLELRKQVGLLKAGRERLKAGFAGLKPLPEKKRLEANRLKMKLYLEKARIPENTELGQSLMKLNNPDSIVRFHGAIALSSLKDKRAVPALIDRLKNDDDSGVRLRAAWALCELNDLRAMPALIERMKNDSYPNVCWVAAFALGKLKDVRAVPVLVDVLKNDSNDKVCEHAAGALGLIALANPKQEKRVMKLAEERIWKTEGLDEGKKGLLLFALNEGKVWLPREIKNFLEAGQLGREMTLIANQAKVISFDNIIKYLKI